MSSPPEPANEHSAPASAPAARPSRWAFGESVAAALLCTVLTFVVLGGLTLLLWSYERVDTRQAIISETQLLRTQVARQLSYLISDQFSPIRQFKRDLHVHRMSLEAFEDAAESLRSTMPFITLLARVDRRGHIQAAVGPEATNLVGHSIVERGELSQLLTPPRLRWREGVESYRLAGRDRIAFFAPMAMTIDGKLNHLGGLVVEMDFAALMERLLDEPMRRSFAVAIIDEDGQTIFSSGEAVRQDETMQPEPFRVVGQEWRLQLSPTAQFVASKAHRWRMWLLWVGLLISAVAAAAVWQAMHYRRHDRRLTRTYISSLHALNEVAAAISSGGKGSVLQLLERLTHAAANFLDMSKCVIGLYDWRDRTLQIVYRRGIDASSPELRSRYSIDDLLGSKTCLETGQLVYEGDIEREGSIFDKQTMRAHNVRSILIIPMMVNGDKIGTITLGDPRPKKFTDIELRMASLWGSQAAVTIVNHHLYQRMERSMQTQRKLLAQLETMYRVNTLIYQAHSPADALQRIADLAPWALEFDLCVVCLANAATRRLRAAAVTAAPAPLRETAPAVEQCLHRAQVLENGRPVIVSASAGDALERTYLPSGVGSGMYLPLIGADQSKIGVLAMLRRSDATPTPQQVHIAELFAGRAAVAIENTRLYEQTQRDAETMTMLLRELNHRVKNNLAGIAGLLSMRPPDLSPDATAWLDRLAERITTMSRVHELFAGGMSVVALSELIDTALESVKAIKPPGVRLRVELDRPDVQLPTDRAVTLAMVLHELCYNALAHGVGHRGNVLIRSRMLPQQRMAIDVIDDGAASPAVAAVAPGARAVDGNGNGNASHGPADHRLSGGMGLGLVRGLVGRELRGEFAYQTNIDGGVTATVDFPLTVIDPAKE